MAAQPEMTAPYAVADADASDRSERLESNSKAATLEQYEKYYSSGAYDLRYPCANQSTLQAIRSKVTQTSKVLDFGCGSGRYTLPLAAGCQRIVAYDPCPAAIKLLKDRSRWHKNIVHTADPDDILRAGPYDVGICIFGVLSHILDKVVRQNTLRFLKECLGERGWLLVSVPNRLRRFYREQLVSALQHRDFSGQVHFYRGSIDQFMPFYLYTEESLRAELQECGFFVQSVKPESLLPEALVTKLSYACEFEKSLLPRTPAWLGYGLLATARCV